MVAVEVHHLYAELTINVEDHGLRDTADLSWRPAEIFCSNHTMTERELRRRRRVVKRGRCVLHLQILLNIVRRSVVQTTHHPVEDTREQRNVNPSCFAPLRAWSHDHAPFRLPFPDASGECAHRATETYLQRMHPTRGRRASDAMEEELDSTLNSDTDQDDPDGEEQEHGNDVPNPDTDGTPVRWR